MRTVVSAWHGVYLLEGESVVRTITPPLDAPALAARAAQRAVGELTPEERAMLAERGPETWATRDRRLVGPGVELRPDVRGSIPFDPSPALRREYLLRAAQSRLESSWDPSVHIEEAVRAVRDVDRARNLLGERVASWAGRDSPELGPDEPDRAARRALEVGTSSPLGPSDPRLVEARRELAELYRDLGSLRDHLEAAVAGTMPARTPNLADLLGPDLAGRLLAQAGGLDRLARLPASTIQVLGAERAFFEHLRGRAPPPRHGLLFLHPQIQSAPRTDRGKLARALAGKVAIAARKDQAGAAVAPELKAAFARREEELRQRRSRPRAPRAGSSATPLHRATGDR